MKRKLLGILLAALLAFSAVPATLFAQGEAPASVKDAETLAFWDFETDPEADGWIFIDEDGDGYNWICAADTAAGAPIAASGTNALRSFSYYSGPGALTPDNWAITPAVELPEGQATLSYYIASYSGNYPETYRVYIFAGDSDEPTSVTEDLVSPDSMRVFEERTVDLSAFAGQSVKVAFRHYNCSNQFRVYIDDVSILASGEPETPVEPPAEPELIFGSYFEEDHDPIDEGWQFVDADGDTHTWMWHATSAGAAYEGSGIIGSHSYNYGWGGELHPDNWAVSPAIELPAEELSVTFYARGYDSYFPVERFEVYAGTSDNIEEMSEILTATATTASWTQYTADLSDFANETVYIAIRHCTESGGDSMILDQFEVWGREGEEPIEPELIGDVDGDGEVTAADALLAMRHAMGLEELSEEQLARADADGDGEVTMFDCLLIQRRAMEIISAFHIELD
ncbi:MAG: choice-of-anchor J domain-containing protein [Clostridia bacterium]|nr:choice-of-anchor J domain-containing protein [Clostridia bacterium]